MSFRDKKLLVLVIGLGLVAGLAGYLVFFDNQFVRDLKLSDDRLLSDEAIEARPPVVNQFVG